MREVTAIVPTTPERVSITANDVGNVFLNLSIPVFFVLELS